MSAPPVTDVGMRWHAFLGGGLLLVLILASSSASAQTYRLSWGTANGAGAIRRTPVYELGGTAGEAEAAVGRTGRYTLNSGFWAVRLASQSPAPPPPVRINEWLIANHSTIVDPADGHYEGWIELFNYGPNPILLGNWSLTDSIAQPSKFMLPGNTVLAAGGYLLVWADNEPTQAGLPPTNSPPSLLTLHASFTLAPGGGEIGLFDASLRLVDQVTYATQTEDFSEGRFPPGAVPIYLLSVATPGGPNALAPSTITVQPIEASVTPGDRVEFCVEAVGDGPLAYQWRRNGVNLPVETNACLLIKNAVVADGGSYSAVVSNPQGASVGGTGRLLVTIPEVAAANRFTDRKPLTGTSNTIRGDNSGTTREPGEPFHFRRFSSNSVWYSWTAPETGLARFDTRGSHFDTLLAIYQGNELGSLVEVASDDDRGGSHTSEVQFNVGAGQRYEIAIDTLEGLPGPFVLNWSVEVTGQLLPQIERQPEGATVQQEGQPASFSVEASGEDLTYQWFRNGQLVPRATGPAFSIPAVRIADLGQYSVVVTSRDQRAVESLQAPLEIGLDPLIQSRDKIAELLLPAGGAGGSGGAGGPFVPPTAGTILDQTLNNGRSTKGLCEPEHCRVPGGASRWFVFTAPVESVCAIEVSGSNQPVVLAVYLENDGICTDLYADLVACSGGATYLEFPASAQAVYRLVVDTLRGAESTIQVRVRYCPVSFDRLLTQAGYFLKPRGSSLVLSAKQESAQESGDYQWQADGANLAGKTRAELRLPRVEFSDARRYAVCIRNTDGSVLCRQAVLGVIEGQVLTHDTLRTFQLLGRTPAPLQLDTAHAVGGRAAWTTLLISRSSDTNPNAPELWHSSATSISNVFYKARPPGY